MNYREFFEKALSEAYKEAPLTDDTAFVGIIEERAKKMNRKAEKRYKVLHGIMGAAAAVAVIGGSVLGINFLSEHGGLKEGGIGSSNGAGYHEDVTEPAETTPVTTDALIAAEENTEQKDILQSGYDVLEFSDMTATIHKIDYDGQYLRVMVEAEYHYPVSEVEGVHRLGLHVKDNDKYDVGEYCLNDYQYVTAKYYQEIAEMIWNDPNVENWDESADMERIGNTLMYDIGIYIRLDPGQTAELQFEYHPAAVGIEWEYAGNYTLTGIDTTDALCTVTNSVTNTTVSVSKWGVLVEGPYNLEEIENFSLAVKYKDGMEKILADRSTKPEHNPSNDIPYYEFPAYYTDLGRGRDYIMSSLFMEGKIDVENIASVVVNGEEIGVASNVERESFISIEFRDMKAEFEFTYYIDGELQEDMTETRDMSDKQHLRWDVKGTGIHKYEIFGRNTDTDVSGKLLDMDIDFSKDPPERTINDDSLATDLYREIVEQEIQQGDLSQIAGIYGPGEEPYDVVENEETTENTTVADLPEFPIAISNGNGFYGEFLDTPITGDEAWELVKERGGIDIDYPLPYDKSLFTFDGCSFYIDWADCDATAITGGTVVYAGWYNGFGYTVVILDENGHYWMYYHLEYQYEDTKLKAGDTVNAGDIIGHTGSSGFAVNQRYSMRVG